MPVQKRYNKCYGTIAVRGNNLDTVLIVHLIAF